MNIVGKVAMGVWVGATLLLAACAPSTTTTTITTGAVPPTGVENENGPGRCGIERWSVKTMTDSAAGDVKLTPIPSSVASLGAMPAPADPKGRTSGEKKVYRIKVSMIAFKQEADSDIHLAVVDPTRQDATMIVEFPASNCDVGSVVKNKIDKARARFVAACGQPTNRYQHINGSATITGVLFFDRIHGQLGVAPNGVELHPALSFVGKCRP